jgi:hypothetical protein
MVGCFSCALPLGAASGDLDLVQERGSNGSSSRMNNLWTKMLEIGSLEQAKKNLLR